MLSRILHDLFLSFSSGRIIQAYTQYTGTTDSAVRFRPPQSSFVYTIEEETGQSSRGEHVGYAGKRRIDANIELLSFMGLDESLLHTCGRKAATHSR